MNWRCRFFFQAEDGIRDIGVTGVQTCALPISTGQSRCFSTPKRPNSQASGETDAIRLRRPLAISVSAAAKPSAGGTSSAEKKSGIYRSQCIRFRVYHRLWHTSRVQYELLVGLRYTRAERRNHFISFISLTSMLGIALGVAALIVVLSVMNGFQKEVRARILGVVSHVQITGADNRLAHWQTVARDAAAHPHAWAAAPVLT